MLVLTAAAASAQAQTFTISGFVVDENEVGVRGVTVTLSGSASGTAVTAGDGSYTFNSLASGGDYTVTPSLPRYNFSPTSRTFTNLTSNRTATFFAALQTFNISGVVRDPVKNLPLNGVTVTLSGSKAQTTTTNFDGNYTFSGLTVGGDYTVTVSQNLTGAVFFDRFLTPPVSRSFANLSANVTADFGGVVLAAAAGAEPKGVAAADFNGDGRLDAAVATIGDTNHPTGTYVVLGRGDGTFDPAVAVAPGGLDVFASDLNGDGKPDLAVSSGGLDVALGNGDGTFQPSVNYPYGLSPIWAASGDFNGDGKPDFAAVGITPDINSQRGIKLLTNKGDGTFQVGPLIPLSFSPDPRKIEAADFNSDGKSDLVVLYPSSTLRVMLSNGNGTFAAPLNFTTTADPWFVTPGDFNGDGKLDMAVGVSLINNGLEVLTGNGDGTFQRVSTFTANFGPMTAADVNGDGKLDLVTANSNNLNGNVKTFFGDGAGAFALAGTNFVGTDPMDIAAGDFNNDGRPDIAVVNRLTARDLTVLRNVLGTPTVEFSSATNGAAEQDGSATVSVTRSGDISQPASVDYSTSDGTARERSDYITAAGTLHFLPGEATKFITVFITNDTLVEGAESLSIALGNPVGVMLGVRTLTTLTLSSDDQTSASNAIDGAQFFVTQHYRDFLNREPDAPGLAFWTNQTTGCGNADLLVCRINVSAAFFLSPEFQETGGFVIRAHRVTTGGSSGSASSRIRYLQFIRDARQVGEGAVDGQPDFAQRLAANKQTYAEGLVGRSEFRDRFPTSLSAAGYVDALYASAGVTPTADERQAAVAVFGLGDDSGRAAALIKVADSNSVRGAETRTAFVLMEYFGYLRRNPNDPPDVDDSGYQFWLGKLNDHGGNYITAEMVKAFITSGEYRGRFGQ